MSRTIIFLISILIVSIADAQQVPQYSHYLFNQFQINPAVAGSKECLDLRFGYRNQWVGFENSPRTGFASVNGTLGKVKRNGTFHGIGIMFEADNTAPFSKTNVNLAYAYHFKMNRNMRASIGLFAGFTQYRLDLGTVLIEDGSDPLLLQGSQTSLLVPEVSPGFWMYNENFFLGASIKHITGNTTKDDGEASLVSHFNLSTGYSTSLSKTTSFIPSLLLKYAPAAPMALDLNAMIDFDNRLAIGLGYRNGDAVVALMKFNFFNAFTLGYAYDMTTSPIRTASSNGHEFVLGISACPGTTRSGYVPCAAYD
jgi:type IX secretion system PorP/SprF family membrane protein